MEFSASLNEVMNYAGGYASKSGGEVGTEHIMLGILSVDTFSISASSQRSSC